MRALVTGAAVVLLAWLFLAGFGGITVLSPAGLDIRLESDYAEAQAVYQANETERARIAAELERSRAELAAQTNGEAQTTLRVLAVVTGLTVAAVVWARRPARALPPARLLAYIDAHYEPGRAEADMVDGEWAVVDHDKREIVPASRLFR